VLLNVVVRELVFEIEPLELIVLLNVLLGDDVPDVVPELVNVEDSVELSLADPVLLMVVTAVELPVALIELDAVVETVDTAVVDIDWLAVKVSVVLGDVFSQGIRR
jgi:hypothetical protein